MEKQIKESYSAAWDASNKSFDATKAAALLKGEHMR
jgi:hypothetical protein